MVSGRNYEDFPESPDGKNCYNCKHVKEPGYAHCINCYNIMTMRYENWQALYFSHLTVGDVIDTMNKNQKETLYYYVGKALKLKMKLPKTMELDTFDNNQKKVFYYLVGLAMEERDKNIFEIVVGNDNGQS